MLVADQHTPSTMWQDSRLRPYFVRKIAKGKAPVGKVYLDKSTGNPEYRAEIEEVILVTLANETGKEERVIAIDPRHPQCRDQLKYFQEVSEGRVGGLTPVRLANEYTHALDPEGREIAGTKILRVAELESPQASRGEGKVVLDGQNIGEWTVEIDSALDRAVSFRMATEFSDYMEGLEHDPAALEWKEISAAAHQELTRELLARVKGLPEAEASLLAEQYAQSRENFLAGRHPDPSDTEMIQSVWDPIRSPKPDDVGALSAFLHQRCLIERFQRLLTDRQMKTEAGVAVETNLVDEVETQMVEHGHLPCRRPVRHAAISRIVTAEKARITATHMLAGSMVVRGAEVRSEDLKKELKEPWRLHADTLNVLEAAKVPRAQQPGCYFKVGGKRAGLYMADAAQAVDRSAHKTLKFPKAPEPEENNHMESAVKAASSAGKAAKENLLQAMEHTESVSLGFGMG